MSFVVLVVDGEEGGGRGGVGGGGRVLLDQHNKARRWMEMEMELLRRRMCLHFGGESSQQSSRASPSLLPPLEAIAKLSRWLTEVTCLPHLLNTSHPATTNAQQ